MDTPELNRYALTALLDAYIAQNRWPSRAAFCTDAAITPSHLSLAEKGQRGMSPEKLFQVADTLRVPVEAITCGWEEEDPYLRRVKHDNGRKAG